MLPFVFSKVKPGFLRLHSDFPTPESEFIVSDEHFSIQTSHYPSHESQRSAFSGDSACNKPSSSTPSAARWAAPSRARPLPNSMPPNCWRRCSRRWWSATGWTRDWSTTSSPAA
ncbi:protein of unknown function [Cupriavidus taiwanensis]|nr:protein of unknown function [Cupriavidus taiwanensis]